ncbi:MAG: hypothetical protein HRT64_03105 [Erythrobacter sp.]|nr:hypothetical protein [Erythrobacter sp.]
MSISRRSFLLGTSALVLAACGGGESSTGPIAGGPAPSPSPTPQPTPTPEPTPTPTPTPTSPYDATATELDPYLAAITAEMVLFNAKNRDYRISLVETSEARFRMHIWDEELGRQTAGFEIRDPDYDNLPERVLVDSFNPLLPTQFSGLQGFIKLNRAQLDISPAVRQFGNPESGRINRNNVTKRSDYRGRHWADDFEEVIQVGAGREFATIREALESLYEGGPLADQENSTQVPVCLRANPLHRIALVFDPSDQPYLGVSEHVPDWVYLGGREREGTVFEHGPGATGALIEGQANTGAFDLTLRNTAPPGPGRARYAWHTDYVHLFQSRDSEGDINRDYAVNFERVRFIVGEQAAIQPFGAGIGVQAAANFVDCDFDCENPNFRNVLVAANNSSNALGGGRFTFRNCRDLSNRGANVSTIGVQTKTDAENPNVVEVNDCVGFSRITLSPGSAGVFAGKWLLRGNTSLIVDSRIPGDVLRG